MGKEVSCRVSSSILRYVESQGIDPQEFLKGFSLGPIYLSDPNHWINIEKSQALFRRAQQWFNQPDIAFAIGQAAEENKALGVLPTLFQLAGNMRRILEHGSKLMLYLDRALHFSVVRISDDNALIELRYPSGLESHRSTCDFLAGLLSSIPQMWGEPSATIIHEQCSAPVHGLILPDGVHLKTTSGQSVLGAKPNTPTQFEQIGKLSKDGTFTYDQVTYGAGGCVLKITWSKQEQRGWRRIFPNNKGRRRVPDQSESDIRETEEKLDALFMDNSLLLKRVEEQDALLRAASGQLREVKARLDQSEKQQSEIVSDMSHELRTPINAIMGFSDLLSQGIHGELNPKQKNSVERIAFNTRNLLSILNDVLDYSKLEAGRMTVTLEPIDLHSVCKETLNTVSAMAENKGVALNLNIDDDTPSRFISDKTKLKQILLNLLSNSIKFTDEGRIELRLSPKNGMWFSVKDTGRGIDPTDMDRLFEKFTPASLQTSGKQPSSGLGLNITQRLVELLGGKIEVRSERGVGSRFSVWLPYLNKRRPKSKSDGPEAVLSTRVSRTILVVEPDEQIASLMKLPIEAEGFSVTISADIDHAMAFALQEKPAAVVLEPMLPRKDGWEFLTKLKENPKTQDIPVIIHSIVAEPQLADSLGASANLVKPVTPQKLIDTLMQTMEEGETRQK